MSHPLFSPEAVEAELERFLAARPMPENLRSACRYALLGGGKRLRPILTMHACAAAGGRAEDALAPAAALEMVHAFSLVHDDLPALDNDDLRRGRPTLHKHAGEAMAVLAGDSLLGLAFELLAETRRDCGRTKALPCALVLELAQAVSDMIAGQVQDTIPDFSPDVSPEQKLETIHRNKTGALLRCACRMGARCARADADTLARLTHYGETIGVLYQAVDDLLDVTVTSGELGKATGKDAAKNKVTFPGVYGVEGTRAQIQKMLAEALETVAPLGAKGEPLAELARMMAHRTK